MLQIDSIRLRPLSITDVDSMMLWINDQEINKFISRVLPLCKEDELDWVNSLKGSKTDIVFGICHIKDENEILIGTCGLHHIDWINRDATLGIAIGIKSYWRKKCGTKALSLLIQYAFDQLNLHRLSASAFDENERSIKLQEKCGLIVEGRRRDAFYRHGKHYDEVILGIMREDYVKQHSV